MANAIGEFIGTKTSSVSTSSFSSGILIFFTIILVGIGLTLFTIWLINYFKYNKKIVLFRKVGNNIVPVLDDKAMFERIGAGGDYWCKLKKCKKILPRPTIQMAKNTFWFYEREDGEWINFCLGDFDKQMKAANAFYVDEDMRLQRLGIQKNLMQRFQKITFWEKYGGMIVSIIYILIVTVCLVVLFQKMTNSWDKAAEMSQAVKEMALEVKNMRVRTTSGAVPISSIFIPFLFKRRKKNAWD